jgi:CBS domain-containing protein
MKTAKPSNGSIRSKHFEEATMSVRRILDQKGSAVFTISPGSTLADAARMLVEHRIGALIVAGPDRSVAGILSERDIVRAVANGGMAALDAKVSTQMTSKVITCAPASTIHEVMGMMSAGKFRHVPVLSGGQLEGMISIGDVVKHRLAELEHESQSLRDYILS